MIIQKAEYIISSPKVEDCPGADRPEFAFIGRSNVGKSSLINLILPDLELRTKDVSGWSGKGLHTTTFAEMFDLPFGGKIIDTPGISGFNNGIRLNIAEQSDFVPQCLVQMLFSPAYNNIRLHS